MTRSGSSLNNAHTMFMTYDMSDQMVGMSGHNLQEDALTASYQYNGLGKRVYTNMNGRQSYPMYDAGGALREVYKVHDGERVNHISLQNGHPLAKWTGSTLTYLHADHLGTPIRGTHGSGGTSGLTVGDESFQDFSTPYGLNPTSGWWGNGGSGFDPATGQGSNCGVTGFTTHAKDCESGLQYMQARHYSPVVGRFLSVDPVGFLETEHPSYLNRYRYCANDPVNCLDPTGMSDKKNFLEKAIDKIQSIQVAPAWQPSSAMDTVVSNSQLSGDVRNESVAVAGLETTAKGIVEAIPEVAAIGGTVAAGLAVGEGLATTGAAVEASLAARAMAGTMGGLPATAAPVAPAVTTVGTGTATVGVPVGLGTPVATPVAFGIGTPAPAVTSLGYRLGSGYAAMAGTTRVGKGAAALVGGGAAAKVLTDNER